MAKKSADIKPEKKRGRVLTIFYISVLTIITIIVIIEVFTLVIPYITATKESRQEHTSLLDFTKRLMTGISAKTQESEPHISDFDIEMRRINSEYVCWLQIEDTNINHPVVRGEDNEKYLNTSFYGEKNILGTLFMDYRCAGDYVPHIIIYGHNSRYGDMFGSLRDFLSERYFAEHPVIALKINDRIFEYEIFSARKTDINDPVYTLGFSSSETFGSFAEQCGAPPDTTQIVTLSTCVSGGNKEGRFIVQAALRK